MIAGNAPMSVGRIPIKASEMMFVQYMPIKMPDVGVRIPQHLMCFYPIIEVALCDNHVGKYIYLTAKHLYVDRDRCFNRPGWHTDGFGTDDINYIWCDRAPTEFCVQPFILSDDCDESMAQMEAQAMQESIRTYESNTLLRLDSTVVHRAPVTIPPGYRTFAKLSISRDRYNLEGNARNYLFDYDWPMMPRAEKRNHPAKSQEKYFAEPLAF
jgi:hypothetical protein